MLDDYLDMALAVVREHIELAEPIVFMLGFAESIIFLSLMVPSTALFLGIGGIHAAAGGDFLPLWLAASAGAALGDAVTFAMGRYFKGDLRHVWPLSKRPHWCSSRAISCAVTANSV